MGSPKTTIGNDNAPVYDTVAVPALFVIPVTLEGVMADGEDDNDGEDGDEEGGAEDAHGEVAEAGMASVLRAAPWGAGVGGTLVFFDHL